MANRYTYTLFPHRADLRLFWEVTDGILASLGESFSKAKTWFRSTLICCSSSMPTIYKTSLSGCILQNVQRHNVLKLSLWQARFPISYRFPFPIIFQRQKYMQYKQNTIDMKQWIFLYAEEMSKENKFFGRPGSFVGWASHKRECKHCWKMQGNARKKVQGQAGLHAKSVFNNVPSNLH